jgi:DNA repair ATPase RecN
MSLPAQFQALKHTTIEDESFARQNKMLKSEGSHVARYSHQIKRALRKPTPRTFYPALIRFLTLQERLFTNLLDVRTVYGKTLQEIVDSPDTHPQTLRRVSQRLVENHKAIKEYQLNVWEIENWLKRAQSNWKKHGTPHFSNMRFLIDVNEVSKLLQK